MRPAHLLFSCSFLLAGSLCAQKEGPPPAPSPVPASASAGPVRMPLPPEFARDAVLLVKAGSARSSFFGKPRPIAIKPYAIRDLKTGKETTDAGSSATRIAHFRTVIGLHWQNVENGFSFRVTDEADPPAELGHVACDWGVSQTSAEAKHHRTGVQVKIPGPSTLVCGIVTAPGEDPWEFHLWTDRPTEHRGPRVSVGRRALPGSGPLRDRLHEPPRPARAEVADHDGHALPPGRPPRRRRRAAAARPHPGAALLAEPAERSLLVLVGAAVFTFDFLSQSALR